MTLSTFETTSDQIEAIEDNDTDTGPRSVGLLKDRLTQLRSAAWASRRTRTSLMSQFL